MQSERQIQIIESSIELIATKGIQGFTIKNLSKAIGISEPGIYRHFDSKTEILLSILTSFKEMAEMLSGMLDDLQVPAIEKIEFMFTRMLELFSTTPSLVSVIFAEEIFKSEELLKLKITEVLNTHAQNIENIITIGQEENNVRKDIEAKTMTLIIMGSLRLLVKRWDLNNHDFDLQIEGSKLIISLDKIIACQ